MKALSIKQPWAWLIVNGYKGIENRKWKSSYRGELYIHAGKQIDMEAYNEFVRILPKNPKESRIPDFPSLEELKKQTGGLVGKVIMTGCVTKSDDMWFQGPYGFVLEEAETIPFYPMKGQLSIFNFS